MQKMSQFDSLLEQGAFVQKKMAESKEEGLMAGLVTGKEEGRTEMLLRVVQTRFPVLCELAQQKLDHLQTDKLNILFDELVIAQNETEARAALTKIHD